MLGKRFKFLNPFKKAFKVVCISDNWYIVEGNDPGPYPVKGQVYTVVDDRIWDWRYFYVLAGFNQSTIFRARCFVPLDEYLKDISIADVFEKEEIKELTKEMEPVLVD